MMRRIKESTREIVPLKGMTKEYQEGPHFQPLLPREDYLTQSRFHPISNHHHSPSQANEEPISPGHIGGRVWRIRGIRPGLPGKIDINRIFRQDGDQREKSNGQRLRNVELREFGSPRQKKRRAKNRDPGRQGFPMGLQMHAGKMDNQPLQREG
jgi:hypothetical protein